LAVFISEIFHSIQGEGSLTGMPSVFIRTSGCNLRCAWCDTPYASWHPEGEELTVPVIMERVAEHQTRFVVITGGEPMIAKGMTALLRALRKEGKHITIETAGTAPPGVAECDLASLSPKLANSTPTAEKAGTTWYSQHERRRRQPAVLRAWCEKFDYQLKFVISTPEDIREAESLMQDIGIVIPPHKVLLMPEGTDGGTLAVNTPLLIETCKAKGYRLSPRMHIEWFGNTRGT
jgi:7-carboxy-7-deazaguanine synthase